jgi:hypothetical protein
MVVLLALSAPLLYTNFYLSTQTGYLICDDSKNCFVSHFSPVQLQEEASRREERWRGVPEGALAEEKRKASFWAFEDYFLTEARAHFRLGNNAAATQDWTTACGEIQIVVDHYSPAVAAMGVRPQDYNCSEAPHGFHSHAFGRLDTEANPFIWWSMASLAALVLFGFVSARTKKKLPAA